MKNPILTICIPTYNRAKFAYEAAINLLNKWDGDEIEVLISDNHSEDNTEELISTIKDQRLSYYRNDTNLGAAFNTHLTFLKAKGQFAYLTSDEDDLNISEIPYLIDYFANHPNTAVFIGGGDLTYTKKRFPDACYDNPFDALKAIAFQTRYMTGIILNQKLYAQELSHVTFEESANIWDAYSFMYAIAKLCCLGEVVTSSHLLFEQPRLTMTDISNNARKDGIYYYEPEGRINQMRTWSKEIIELPISEYEKRYMVIKIIYDTVLLATRIYMPGYVNEVKITVPESDFNVYYERIKKLDKSILVENILESGNQLYFELFKNNMHEETNKNLVNYINTRQNEIG